MKKEDIFNLMKSSENGIEWNENYDKVKEEFKSDPEFWYIRISIESLYSDVVNLWNKTRLLSIK